MAVEKHQDLQSVDHEILLKEIAALATQYDMFRFLKKTTDLFGLRAFMVLRLPGATTQSLQAASIISSWPAELLSRFDQANLVTNSAIVARLRDTIIPFTVDLTAHAVKPEIGLGKTEQRGHESFLLFSQYQMSRSAYFPVCEPNGERGAVGFWGDRAPCTYELLQLFMIATHVYDRLHHIGRKDIRSGEELTEREIDCLNWTAAGKTSAEISDILGLSEHTVNHYLNRATRKLDTVNRTQAVAKALRTGIIS